MIDGDAKSAAIAAASVIAKETRDRYMRRADAAHPGWEFAQHVGYSTPEHREAIERLGVSPLHRLSFQSMAYQQLALAERAAPDAAASERRPTPHPGARTRAVASHALERALEVLEADQPAAASSVTPIASKRTSSA